MVNRSVPARLMRALMYLFLLAMLLFTVFPLVYAFFGSFKNNIEFLAGGANILPQSWDFQNYVYAWKEANFARYTYNSFFISTMTVVMTVIIAGMAGYVLARAEFRFKSGLMLMMGLVMFIPNVVLIFPIFQICQKIGLFGSLWSMVITQTAAGLPFSVMLISSYMSGISKEIDEAARVDGCGFFRIFLSILMPLSKPILATTALIAFKNAWNSYLMPLALSLSKPEIRPLTVGVISLKDMGEGISAWNIMIAGSVLSIAPMVVVYLLMNRYFIEGMTAGSVKG